MSYATRGDPLSDAQVQRARTHQVKLDALIAYLRIGNHADANNLFYRGTVTYTGLASNVPIGPVTLEPAA